VGYNLDGAVNYCYSIGEVAGERYVGGLVGYNLGDAQVLQCYSSGIVYGNGSHVGGLVGYGREFEVIFSFWDIQTLNQIRSAGGMGLTTGEMQEV
jgi:hypothetical protein